jgi:hypothetical protein
MSSSPKILRPSPRRPFNYSSAPNQPPSPLLSPSQPDETPSRTHSILNLTSSTLLGIYSPTSYQTDAEFDPPLTPWGTGAETPQMQAVQRASAMLGSPPSRRKTFSSPPASSTSVAFSIALRSILLFGTGMGYGWLVRHLHDDRQVAPFQVEGIIKPRNDWRYLVFWGVAGVALGSLLPWVDTLFATNETDTVVKSSVEEEDTVGEENSGIFGADWTPVVRSVGAFVGIAYAIVCSPPVSSWFNTNRSSANFPGHQPCKPLSPSLLSTRSYGTSSTARCQASSSAPPSAQQEPHFSSSQTQTRCLPPQHFLS